MSEYKLINNNILNYDEILYFEMKDKDCADKDFNYRTLKDKIPDEHLLPISPIKDQLKLGSCTAFAACGCLETLVLIYKKIAINLSEQYCYSVTKLKDPWRGVWYSGTSTVSASQAIREGICHENLCEYIQKEFVKPRDYMHDDADNRKCIEIHYLNKSIVDIKQAIAQNMPVMCAIRMFQGFKNKYLENGVAKKLGYVKKSGHAVMIYGYDKHYFYIKNSWGVKYGNKGVVKIPQQMLFTVLKTVIAIEGVKEPFDTSVPEKKKYKPIKKPWWKFW